MEKCLFCYGELAPNEVGYHTKCAKKIFGSSRVPQIPYSRDNINTLAKELVQMHTNVTGVQPKMSLHIARGEKNEPDRLTLVGIRGGFILKPQAKDYTFLPENEDLTMHLAEAAGIKVVPHTLARMADGELCYLTRRIDRRDNGEKIPMEDACQLTERLTENKYHSSYEQVAKVIKSYSKVGKLDLVNYWEVVVFSWLTGNSDMHLKNFSLYESTTGLWQLTPAYDLLSVHLAMPSDKEELALTLNGKKNRINAKDFITAMSKSGIDEVVVRRMIKKFTTLLPKWESIIENSFLPKELQTEYISLVRDKISQIQPK